MKGEAVFPSLWNKFSKLFIHLASLVGSIVPPPHPNKKTCRSPDRQHVRVKPYLDTGSTQRPSSYMRSLGWGPEPTGPGPSKRGSFGRRDGHAGEGHMRRGTELDVRLPQAQEHH